MSYELQTFIIAATPILELRGAIPIALFNYKLSVTSAFIFSVLGNIFPVIFILLFLGKVSLFLRGKSKFFDKFFDWLFARTKKNHQSKYDKFKDLFLVVLVSIPLPLTGAWTGSLCAFLFGVPFKRAFSLISLGVIIAGVIVTLISLGIITFI
jgi:uncharacterized membrane protein